MNKKMKRIIAALAIAISLLNVNAAKAQTKDFSGSWKRNDAQSDPGDLSINSIPTTLVITQDQKAFYITATLKNKEGKAHTSSDTLNMDGTQRIVNRPTSKRASGLAWSADHKGITVTIAITDPQGTLLQKWVQPYALINDGKSLRIAVDLTTDGEDYHLEEVFDKQ